MKLIVKSPVWDDLREIGMRIGEEDPQAAERFFTAARVAFSLIEKHPRIGRRRSFSTAGVRSWGIAGFRNYIIFYVPSATEVQILAVVHGARDLPEVMAERLE